MLETRVKKSCQDDGTIMLMAIMEAKVIYNLPVQKKKKKTKLRVVHYQPYDRGYLMGRPL